MSKIFYEDAESRWTAIEAAIKADAEDLYKFRQIQDMLAGKIRAMTNPCYEYIVKNLAETIWSNPSLVVESRIPGEPMVGAMGLRYSLESLLARQGWLGVWERCFADAFAWRGVSIVSTEEVAAPRYAEGLNLIDWRKQDARKIEKGDMIKQPKLTYIPPDMFFTDPEAQDRTRARFMGHSWIDSVARLVKESEKDGSDIDVTALKSASNASRSKNPDAVTVRQMFVPNYFDPIALESYDGDEDPHTDGLHTGTLFTMVSEAQGAADLRKPRLYRGPACGPYQVYDAIQLPGMRHRSAPLAIVLPQIDQLASVGEAVLESAEGYRSITLATEQVVKALSTTPHDGLYAVGSAPEDLAKAIQRLEVGGVPRELLEALQLAKDAVEITLGTSDTQRGRAASGTTATAEELANRNTDIKTGMVRNALHASAERSLHVAGWEVLHAADFHEVLPPEALSEGMRLMKKLGLDTTDAEGADLNTRVLYTGGDALSDKAEDSYDGMMVKISPMSMERTSEGLQQRRAIGMLDMIEKIAQLQLAIPGFKGHEAAEKFAGMMNMPGLEDLIPETGGDGQPQGAPGSAPPQPEMTGMAGNESGAMAAGSVQ